MWYTTTQQGWYDLPSLLFTLAARGGKDIARHHFIEPRKIQVPLLQLHLTLIACTREQAWRLALTFVHTYKAIQCIRQYSVHTYSKICIP